MADDDDLCWETTKFFHEQIPITRAMGVAVESYGDGKLVLTAPLVANHNHLGTAFGGSLSAMATLAGYGLLWLLLGERDSHIVVRDSSIRYLRPVRGKIRAVCECPGDDAFAAFSRCFAEKGKARIQLHVTISEAGETCVEFTGTFVVLT